MHPPALVPAAAATGIHRQQHLGNLAMDDMILEVRS
jgi:hypothetical protein